MTDIDLEALLDAELNSMKYINDEELGIKRKNNNNEESHAEYEEEEYISDDDEEIFSYKPSVIIKDGKLICIALSQT